MRPGLIAVIAVALTTSAQASDDVRQRADTLATTLVARMTLDEKVDQLLNVAPAIPRLEVPAYNWWTESLHGAWGPFTTNFPEPIGLAATFDEASVNQVAAAISEEVRALHSMGRSTGRLGQIGTGLDTWSPNINIFRDPRWGRGQETYGEDPFLTARLGVAYVRGMQGPDPDLPDVIATPKHFAVHSGPESTRHQANVYVSPHDLEDTYLPAFRAAIVDGQAGSIMCAYNRVNGEPACASDLLLMQRLRSAWKFRGYVVSDCDAVKDIADSHHFAPDPAAAVAAALKAGVDNECNGATLFEAGDLGARYREAYQRGLISATDIDRALVRLFSARFRNGDLPGLEERRDHKPTGMIGGPKHSDLALHSAERSLVLLKNDGVLPLHGVHTLALLGPHGDATKVLRGNYSSQLTGKPVSLLDGLRQVLPGVRVIHVPWSPSIVDGDPLPESALRSPDGKPGLRAEYFDVAKPMPEHYSPVSSFFAGLKDVTFKPKPTVTRIEPGIAMRGRDFANLSDYYRVVWTGFLVPPETGTYRIGVIAPTASLELDGKMLAKHEHKPWGSRSEMATLHLQKGHRYPLRVTAENLLLGGVEVLWKRVADQPGAPLPDEARQADALVVAVGLNSNLEGEEMRVEVEGFSGGDKTSLDLPADQRHLLEEAVAIGKPVIVVLMNGSPLDLSWARQHAAAILEAWYPGQAGGLAIANVLAGRTNPAGRLPLTFYRSVADLPPFGDYSMKGRTYRYFEGTPVYPFGYGLSYSTFQYSPVRLEAHNDSASGVRVSTTLTNTGRVAGEEVAQLYLEPPRFEGAPRRALRGFERVVLRPGESRALEFDLDARDLSFVTRDGVRQVFAGSYRVSVGSGQPDTGVPFESTTLSIPRDIRIDQ